MGVLYARKFTVPTNYPRHNCFAFGYFWIVTKPGGGNILNLYRISKVTGAILDTYTYGVGGLLEIPFIGANATQLLVGTFLGGAGGLRVYVVNPSNGNVIAGPCDFPAGTANSIQYKVAATPDGNFWVATTTASGISRYDPGTNTVVATINDGVRFYEGSTIYDPVNGFVWAAQGNFAPNAIMKIDPATNLKVDEILIGGGNVCYDLDVVGNILFAYVSAIGVRMYNILTKALIGTIIPPAPYTAGAWAGAAIGPPSGVVMYNSQIIGTAYAQYYTVGNAQTTQTALRFTAALNPEGVSCDGVNTWLFGSNGAPNEYSLVSFSGRRGRKRGGEFWGIIPEIAPYMST